MADQRADAVTNHLERSIAALSRANHDHAFRAAVLAIADACASALKDGGKILIAGNGGSAADAQHIAGEFLSRYKQDRAPLAAIALTTDSAVLTAIGNDYGYEQVFARQVQALGHKGDVLIVLSTSGRSPNVIAALHAAREIGVTTVGFTGTAPSAAVMRPLCDLALIAPTDDTPVIQQIYMVAAHAICELVERDLAG